MLASPMTTARLITSHSVLNSSNRCLARRKLMIYQPEPMCILFATRLYNIHTQHHSRSSRDYECNVCIYIHLIYIYTYTSYRCSFVYILALSFSSYMFIYLFYFFFCIRLFLYETRYLWHRNFFSSSFYRYFNTKYIYYYNLLLHLNDKNCFNQFYFNNK